MGTGCTRTIERIFASFGKINGATVQFENCLDVSNGGVLCALPALISNGLFIGLETFSNLIKGYYTIYHVLILLSFMLLCRIKTIEKLRDQTPGEFGKLLGLDRIPEVRCLRKKMDELCAQDSPKQWSAHLSRHWMNEEQELSGTLYVDGHVRVYNGQLTKIPKKYVSRQRLCLRGTSDYWINDAIGRPFFVIEKTIDPGLIQVIENEMIPRLLQDIPNQPVEEEINKNRLLYRFIIVFDRAGYSPDFFIRLWKNYRIAFITYHKYPKENWPVEWFTEEEVLLPRGEIVTMKLSEMGRLLGTGTNTIWVREVRKLTESGHQTSMISTAYDLPITELAPRMFARWSQENFFKYASEHFGIDLLLEYGTTDFPDTERVINPVHRERTRERNSLDGKLRNRRSRFTVLTMHPISEDEGKNYEKWLKLKCDLLEEIQKYEQELKNIKCELKTIPKYIEWKDLDDTDKFQRLVPGRKCLMDTIRMIAYRAETTMTGFLIDNRIDSSEARRLLQTLFVSDADIIPDLNNKILRIRVHNASRPEDNRSYKKLFECLNESETEYPGSNLRLVYELLGDSKTNLVPSHFPGDQEF